jgi:small subunit ribosomal protein S7
MGQKKENNMRGKSKYKKIETLPDPKYNSTIVAKFINQVMRCGKKSIAERIVYKSFETAEATLKKPALDIFDKALENAGPVLEVRTRRIGGASYQVPMEVKRNRKTNLAMRWIIDAARNKQGKSMEEFLATELMDAYNNTGSAVMKRQNMIKTAEANRAFAHFARM